MLFCPYESDDAKYFRGSRPVKIDVVLLASFTLIAVNGLVRRRESRRSVLRENGRGRILKTQEHGRRLDECVEDQKRFILKVDDGGRSDLLGTYEG